jgi:hypothetical protein
MTAKELLGVLIRAAGLGFLGCGFIDLGHLLTHGLGLSGAQPYPASVVATAIAFWFILGLVIIVSADLVVRLVYRRGS